jgi:hypothetical protein
LALAVVSIEITGVIPSVMKEVCSAALVEHKDFQALREKLVAGDPPSLRELERGLKLVFNLSNSQAERAAKTLRTLGQGEPGKSRNPPCPWPR